MSLHINDKCIIFKTFKSEVDKITLKPDMKLGFVIELNNTEVDFIPINDNDEKEVRQQAINKAKKIAITEEVGDPSIADMILNNENIKTALNY